MITMIAIIMSHNDLLYCPGCTYVYGHGHLHISIRMSVMSTSVQHFTRLAPTCPVRPSHRHRRLCRLETPRRPYSQRFQRILARTSTPPTRPWHRHISHALIIPQQSRCPQGLCANTKSQNLSHSLSVATPYPPLESVVPKPPKCVV